ncbi:hypothetical protein DB313_04855 (plasmid) [Borrelia turcica IST7]|uniref:Uncharacterized protein n=1 Tax=Borrelia turcica IST7 TaxID=1104446 RepID=A0A386PMN0_9SPIR|nr:hypothetical protein [Borrelia turcica]AYE36831.1 hypothetical protein DB313_04855 [Borrelia turcica IST7]
MRYNLLKQCGNKSFVGELEKDLFAPNTPLLTSGFFNHIGLKMTNYEHLREQIESVLLCLDTQENLFKEVNASLKSGLPCINALGLETEISGSSSLQDLFDSLRLESRLESQEGNSSDDRETLPSNLSQNLLSSLIRLANLVPRGTGNTLDFALGSVSGNHIGIPIANLNRENSEYDLKDRLDSPLSSTNAQDKFKLGTNKNLKEFNWHKLVDDVSDTSKQKLNIELRQPTNRVGIRDITYSNFENKEIKDMLTDTGKFETQVDMNDFILKTCGFKSLLSSALPGNNGGTLFDAVKLASYLKTSEHLQDNDEAVSVIYDLFKGDNSRLSSIVNNREHNKCGSYGLGDNFSINFANDACSSGDLVKSRLNSALTSFGSLDSSQGLNSSVIASPLGYKEDMQLVNEQIRELLSYMRNLDFTKNIAEPLSDAFFNMENAINTLADSFKIGMQSNHFNSNMSEYKKGSEFSRMP